MNNPLMPRLYFVIGIIPSPIGSTTVLSDAHGFQISNFSMQQLSVKKPPVS